MARTAQRNTPDRSLLPGQITAIEQQKNDAGRRSIFVDNRFFMGVTDELILEFNLEKGMRLSRALFDELQQAEYYQTVKQYCYKILARRDHARLELYRKAIKKEYPRNIINQVLDELEKQGYLNERSFAEKFAADKATLNNWGPKKIAAALKQKGLTSSDIDHANKKAFEEIDLGELFVDLVLKKKSRFLREENPFKRRKKVFDYLRRKGYHSNAIMKHLDQLTNVIEQ